MINKSSIFRVIEKEHRQRKTMLLCKNSKAEKHFASLLDKALIFYTKEKCCYDKYGNWCYIDFFIPLYNIAIEIDGREHLTSERKKKDIKKESFLLNKRKITTIRYTNDECLKMGSISIIDIVKKAGKIALSKNDIQYKIKNKSEELRMAQKEATFDVYTNIYIYDKDKDVTYKFKDLYIAKHSTGVAYKYLISALNSNKDINASSLFILSKSETEIAELKNKHYESIWNTKVQ